MGNMSYCRFTNTVADLSDCEDALAEIDSLDEIANDEERREATRLILKCRRIANNFGDMADEANRPTKAEAER